MRTRRRLNGVLVMLAASFTAIGIVRGLQPRAVLAQKDPPRQGEPAPPRQDEPLPGAKDPDSVGISRMRRWLDQARKSVKAQNYIDAVAELQKIFDTDEDRTVQLDEGIQAPQESLKFAALSLMGELVESGRTEYETQFGEVATSLLQRALHNGSPDLLEILVRRYFHTQSGYEATFRLASDRLDRGAWLDAAIDFERLRQCPWAAKRFEPDLSLKTALAWHRSGYSEKAEQALAQFRKAGTKQVNVAGKSVPVFVQDDQSIAWLTGVFGLPPEPQGPTDWLVVGGNVRRTAVSRGSTPYLNQGWRKDSIAGSRRKEEEDDALRRILEGTIGRVSGSKPPMIPAPQPLVVGDLLIFRALGGLRAVKSATGEFVWAAASQDPMLDRLVTQNTSNRSQFATLPMFVTTRSWRDQTYGTLSSNGTLVFAVEPSLVQADNPRSRVFPLQMSMDNRLVAYDARTGQSMWEVGTSAGEAGDPFAGAFFLGPPLPVGNRLYGLVDFGGDIRLVCQQPSTGGVDWTQSLFAAQPQQFFEPPRRICGLSPSFAGGIFVCPTEEGAIVAFDRTTRTLLWRYVYDSRNDGQGNMNAMAMRRQQMVMQGQNGVVGNEPDRWLDALALISEDRVLVTPRELNEVLCLDLQTGKVHWRAPRHDGLFLAGVHQGKVIIVGQRSVTARQLLDGKEAWANGPVPIPMPSGRGFVSGGQLFLPLSTGAVVPIHLDGGHKGAESVAREGRVPGNLVATPEAIVSQGIDFIDGYTQFASLEAEIATALEKNPDDASALTLRGEIRLQRGATDEAYADLQRVLKLKPDDQRARKILVDSMLEGLRTDFPKYRTRIKDLDEAIVEVPVRARFLRLVAQGLEESGAKVEAARTYLKLADSQFDPVPPLEHQGVTLAVSRLVRSQLVSLMGTATPDERRDIAAEIRKLWEGLEDRTDAATLRRFLSFVEPSVGTPDSDLSRLCEDARQTLLDALEANGQWLEAELRLDGVARSPDPAVAAPALARWVALMAGSSRPREAVPLLARMQGEFAARKVRGSRTGTELAAEWLAKPELQAAKPVEWPLVKPRAESQPIVSNPRVNRPSIVPVEGNRGPFFDEVTFELNSSYRELTARDGNWQVLWKLALADREQQSHPWIHRIELLDHLVIVSLGPSIVAVDTLGTSQSPGPRVLWKHVLAESLRISPPPQGRVGRRRNGTVDVLGNTIGGLGAVTAELVYLVKPSPSGRSSMLVALDSRTGFLAWSRDISSASVDVFADDEYVCVLPENEDTADVYRALDGQHVGTRVIPPDTQRLATYGRDLLLWKGAPEGKLSRYDVLAGKDKWAQSFNPRSWISPVEDDEILVVEAERRFAVVQTADGKRRIDNPQGMVEGNDAMDWVVQRTKDRYILFPSQGQTVHLPNRSVMARGLNATVIIGTVHGFDRSSGKRIWQRAVDGHGMEIYQSPHLPVVLFLSQINERKPNTPARIEASTLAGILDTRTGEMLYDENIREQAFTVDPVVEPEALKITFRLYQMELSLDFAHPPDEKKEKE